LSQSLGHVTKEQCVHLLKQFAPTALVDGCWLQNVSSAATSHTELAAGLLKLYSHEVGDGYRAQHHGNAYRDLMHSLGIYLPEVGSIAFVEQRDLADAAFRYPVFLLGISQFPRTLAPEILGLSLFYYLCGIGPLYLALRDRLRDYGAGTRFLDLHGLDTLIQGPVETVVRMVEHFMETAGEHHPGRGNQDWRRIRRGFLAAYSASRDEMDQGITFIQSPASSPREKMTEIITRKARHAFGYHHASMMEGRSLDEWLDPDHMDAAQFLRGFARSRHVSPGDAHGSLFFKRLVAFRGPMFRIFSPEELQVIAEWIDSLPKAQEAGDPAGLAAGTDQTQLDNAGCPEGALPLRVARKAHDPESIRRYSRKPLGDLYYHLLNIEQFPDVRPFAKHFATRWLRLAGRGLMRGKRPIPFEPYLHQALDKWLETQHTSQVASYLENSGNPVPSREQLIQSSIQQAPMILIDGAWIQNAANACTSHTAVGSKLFHIYFDEVGNGDATMNHPNVYRELLAQMGVALPEFTTLEFGRWPAFHPESFQVPVFWLSVSQFPKRFLSETLGLNLAMELSGVGGAYRRAIDALRHYGFDPCFVELHNTIDNVSTGHTAWAIEAIKDHMDEMFACGGSELVEEHWHRVWTGYRALVPPKGLKSWLSQFF
ncbi:MAG: hypothetical protein EXS05_13925, partial [Planctomycetaceae bacterium]|nr:hypothetical protein [Planctomycetaceae bacterium]